MTACLANQMMTEIHDSLSTSDTRLEILLDHIPENAFSAALVNAQSHLSRALGYFEEAMDAHDHDHPGESTTFFARVDLPA